MSQSNIPAHTPIQKGNIDWILLRTENVVLLEELEHLRSEIQRMKKRGNPDAAILYSTVMEMVEWKMKSRKLERENEGLRKFYFEI